MKPSLQFIFGNIFLSHFLFRLQASLVLLEGYIPEKVTQIEIVQIEHKIPI
jgi:hypothetical protein